MCVSEAVDPQDFGQVIVAFDCADRYDSGHKEAGIYLDAELFERHTDTQLPGDGSEQIATIKCWTWSFEPGDGVCDVECSTRPTDHGNRGSEEAVVGTDEDRHAIANFDGDTSSTRGDTGVDDREYDTRVQVLRGASEGQATGPNVLGLNAMGDVDDANMGSDGVDDGLCHADKLVCEAVVGEKRDRLVSLSHSWTVSEPIRIARGDTYQRGIGLTLKPMPVERKLALGILGAAGVLVTHEFAYMFVQAASATTELSLAHNHLALLWAVVGPLAGLAVARVGVQRVRRLELPGGLPIASLWRVILPVFLLLEVVERGITGQGWTTALAEPVVWLGLALCGPVAWFLHRFVDVAADAVVALAASAPRQNLRHRRPVRLAWIPALPIAASSTLLLVHSVSRRGPPHLS